MTDNTMLAVGMIPVTYFAALLAWGLYMQRKHGAGKGPSGP